MDEDEIFYDPNDYADQLDQYSYDYDDHYEDDEIRDEHEDYEDRW